MPPKVRDERLAWLAVRDDLERYSRSRPMTFVMRIIGNMAPTRQGLGTDATAGVTTGRMRRWSFAVHDVAQRLDAEERRVLRTTGRYRTGSSTRSASGTGNCAAAGPDPHRPHAGITS